MKSVYRRGLARLLIASLFTALTAAAQAGSFFSIPEAPTFGQRLPTDDNDFSGFFVSARAVGVDQTGFGPSNGQYFPVTGSGPSSGGDWKNVFGPGVAGEIGYGVRYGDFVFAPSFVVGSQWADTYVSGSGFGDVGLGGTHRWLNTTVRSKLGYVVAPRTLIYGFLGAGVDAINYGFQTNRQSRAFGAVDGGLGVEYMPFDHWGVFVEYEFRYDLPQQASGTYAFVDGGGVTHRGFGYLDVSPYSHAVSLGVSYHFE